MQIKFPAAAPTYSRIGTEETSDENIPSRLCADDVRQCAQKRAGADLMSGFKSILVPLGGCRADKDVLGTALNLARSFGAQIECFHNLARPGVPVPANAGPDEAGGLRSIMRELGAAGETRSAAALQNYVNFCDSLGLDPNAQGQAGGVGVSLTQTHGDLATQLSLRAHHNDIIVMERPLMQEGSLGDLLEKVLTEGGRPLLLLHEGGIRPRFDTVMVCWKESAEAARALSAALPFLQSARQVVLTAFDSGDGSASLSLNDAQKHVALHGVRSFTDLIASSPRSQMLGLWRAAFNCHADLLVMGTPSGQAQATLSGGRLPVLLTH